MGKYRCIVPDAPWPERGGGGRGAQEHYETQRVEDIPRIIRSSPMWDPDPSGCHLWLWTMGRYLASGEAAWVCSRLGFRPVKVIPWAKTWAKGIDAEDDDLCMSLGQYGRSAHELILFAVMGSLPQLKTGMSEPDVIIAPVPRNTNGKRIHSRKPPEAFAKIERISPGPRLEMFARSPREGWDVWGNEVDKFAEAATA